MDVAIIRCGHGVRPFVVTRETPKRLIGWRVFGAWPESALEWGHEGHVDKDNVVVRHGNKKTYAQAVSAVAERDRRIRAAKDAYEKTLKGLTKGATDES